MELYREVCRKVDDRRSAKVDDLRQPEIYDGLFRWDVCSGAAEREQAEVATTQVARSRLDSRAKNSQRSLSLGQVTCSLKNAATIAASSNIAAWACGLPFPVAALA